MVTKLKKLAYFFLQMGHFMSNFSTFVVAIIVAFACCWEVGMLSLLVVPMLLMVGATYAKMMIDMSLERVSFVSEATTVVCWCICEPMCRGSYRGPCIGSIYPTILGFGGIHPLFPSYTMHMNLKCSK